jgi:hypothetical protein
MRTWDRRISRLDTHQFRANTYHRSAKASLGINVIAHNRSTNIQISNQMKGQQNIIASEGAVILPGNCKSGASLCTGDLPAPVVYHTKAAIGSTPRRSLRRTGMATAPTPRVIGTVEEVGHLKVRHMRYHHMRRRMKKVKGYRMRLKQNGTSRHSQVVCSSTQAMYNHGVMTSSDTWQSTYSP